jgi:DNA recombination protein RmuC
METVSVVLLALVLLVLVFLLAFNVIQSRKPKEDQSLSLLQQEISNVNKQLAEGLQSNTATVSQNLNAIMELVNKQLAVVNQQLLNSQKTVGERLDSTQKTIGERLDNAARVVGEVQKGLGSLSQATERVLEVGKDIATLQEILRAPKLRGGLGELFLGDLLSQILPVSNYKLQYEFKSGEKVDAAVILGQGIVPIDSKFPLENFRRIIEAQTDEEKKAARKKFVTDVKKHVDAIADKYILPDEGTFDFAIMYIPAENVYYETIIRPEAGDENSISSYALERRVIPASPNSFYAYLQAIVLGLKGMRIEKNAQMILENIERLKGDLARFRTEFDTLGKHLTNAKQKYDDSDKRLVNFEDKLLASGAFSAESRKKPELPE